MTDSQLLRLYFVRCQENTNQIPNSVELFLGHCNGQIYAIAIIEDILFYHKNFISYLFSYLRIK